MHHYAGSLNFVYVCERYVLVWVDARVRDGQVHTCGSQRKISGGRFYPPYFLEIKSLFLNLELLLFSFAGI